MGVEQLVPPPPPGVYPMCPPPRPMRTPGWREHMEIQPLSLSGAACQPQSPRQKSSHLKAKGGSGRHRELVTQGNTRPRLVNPCPCSIRLGKAGRKEARLVWPTWAPIILITLPAERPGMGWGARPAPAPPTLAVTIGLGLEGLQELAAESGEPDLSGSSFPKK